jgi:hypothetical protein
LKYWIYRDITLTSIWSWHLTSSVRSLLHIARSVGKGKIVFHDCFPFFFLLLYCFCFCFCFQCSLYVTRLLQLWYFFIITQKNYFVLAMNNNFIFKMLTLFEIMYCGLADIYNVLKVNIILIYNNPSFITLFINTVFCKI